MLETWRVGGIAQRTFESGGVSGQAGQPPTVLEVTGELLRYHGMFNPNGKALKERENLDRCHSGNRLVCLLLINVLFYESEGLVLGLFLCRRTIFLVFVTAGYRSDARCRNINRRFNHRSADLNGCHRNGYNRIRNSNDCTTRAEKVEQG